MVEWRQSTIGGLIAEGIIVVHKDGNHGSNYPHVEDFGSEGLPFLTAKSLWDWTIDFRNAPRLSEAKARTFKFGLVQAGDVLLSHNATVGRVAVVPEVVEIAVIGTSLTQFRLDPARLLPRFFAIYLSSREFQDQLSFVMAQTTRNQVPITEQRRLPVRVPPISSQKTIADIIFSLVDKIELNRRMNDTLEATMRLIFKDWFVDYGPTHAKMGDRAPYLEENIWSLFPDVLDEDGQPRGWVKGTLGDVARQVGEPVRPEALDPDTPYIGLEHMPRRSIALTDWEGAGKVTSGKLAFRKGDFLFGKLRPYFHKVGIAPIDGICSTDIVALNAQEPKAATFVLACISQDEFVAFTDRTSDGTKMPRTSWHRMQQYGLCIPSGSALEAFNACVEPMVDRIISNTHESRTLATIRDLLLPNLMSGKIRIREAEKLVGGAI